MGYWYTTGRIRWRFENTWEKIDVYLNGEWQGVTDGWGQAQGYVLMKYYPFDMG